MKKLVSTLAAAAMLACMIPSATASAADLTACEFKVTADKTLVHPGDTVTFTVAVKPTGDLYGLSAGLDIPDGLTYQSAALADGLKESLSWDFLDPPGAAEELFFGGTSSKPYTAGKSLVVGTYTCKATKSFKEGTVSLTNVAASNAEFNEIENVKTNKVIVKLPRIVKVPAKEPTCKNPGNKEYWKCEDDCGLIYEDKDGTKSTTIDKVTIAATGKHDIEIINAKEATTEEEGYTGDKVCKICGDVIEKGKTIPKINKTPSDTNESSDSSASSTTVDSTVVSTVVSTVDTDTSNNVETAASNNNNEEKNPNTGIAFAITPTVLAAAFAIIISKKKK